MKRNRRNEKSSKQSDVAVNTYRAGVCCAIFHHLSAKRSIITTIHQHALDIFQFFQQGGYLLYCLTVIQLPCLTLV